MRPNIRLSGIIHIFALLHAGVALVCRFSGIDDELFLTILTMTMVLLICLKKGLRIEFTAASIIVANIIGYLIGNIGADILNTFISNPYTVHALSTAVTTEILGWSIIAFTKIFRKNTETASGTISSEYIRWLILAVAGIFILRLCLVFIFSTGTFSSGQMWETTADIFSNSFIIITLVCFNLIYIRFAARFSKKYGNVVKSVMLVAFCLASAVSVSLIVGSGIPGRIDPDFAKEYPALLATTLLAQITTYCLVYMVNYAFTARTRMQEERGKANLAQYRYVKLKHQVNPHFLFNSLNILDCLVCEEKTEQASTYIHKLAGIYRYMIKSEDEQVVSLREELEFVGRYIDLLQVRFPEGLEVIVSVPEEAMNRYVLPCSLQLLIENAIKHNAVTSDYPLKIEITVKGDEVQVKNNLNPKLTKNPSTGLGQKYIRQLYHDLSGKDIVIGKTETDYCVTLPLL